MRNRREASLSNQIFGDVTAWRAVRNAGRINPSFHEEQQNPKPSNRIAELNEELRRLNVLRKTDLTGSQRAQLTLLQNQFACNLHHEMIKTGHKPIRTKR